MKLGLIGCGRMGKALVVGVIDAGAVAASEVMAYDLYPAALEGLVSERGVTPAGSVAEVAAAVDVLLL
ncbi:MAG: NAD(P)-binding domain-containing protein, partial [Roseibacillus sp.]